MFRTIGLDMELSKQRRTATSIMKNEIKYIINWKIKKKSIEKPPVFIVGCGHSGTSLLLTILGSHSRIYDIPFESYMAMKDKEEIEYLMKYFDKSAIAEGKVRWVEKTPKHITCIKRLLEFSSQPSIIIILRDGRDVACSIKERNNDFEKGVRRWIDDNKKGEEYWKYPNVYVLKYENIISDFNGTITSLLSFLGENFEPSMRDYHTVPKRYFSNNLSKPDNSYGKNHDQYRNWQINQPLFDGRSKWKQKMTEQEKVLFKSLAGEMLISYGYADNYDW